MSAPRSQRSGRSAAAFLVAALAFLAGVFPFAGFAGLIAIVLAARDRGSPRRFLRSAAIVLGGASTALALGWVAVLCEPAEIAARASCPRVYGWDGAQYSLDASMVASSRYSWAQHLDVERALHLAPDGGEYRLRVQNDFNGTDHVDSVEVWVADHAPDVEVLPTVDATLVAVRGALPPRRAVDGAGADVLPLLSADDGRAPGGAIVTGDDGEPRWRWTLDLPRPPGARALLVLRGRGTDFAEAAFARYLAQMGRGMGPFMEAVKNDRDMDCACNEKLLAEELALLHLPLVVTVAPGTWSERSYAIAPIGPGVLRSFVLPIELPDRDEEGDSVTVRIESTPRFWEIDRVAVAPDPGGEVTPVSLKPKAAVLVAGERREDVREGVLAGERRRVTMRAGELIEARFDAPAGPAPGLHRSTFVALRGYYQVPVGGKRLIDVAAVLSHRFGLRSLPRFAATLP